MVRRPRHGEADPLDFRTAQFQLFFDPFVQSDGDGSCVGLGLSNARRRVEANDGVLSARDVPGIACVFTIERPRRSVPGSRVETLAQEAVA